MKRTRAQVSRRRRRRSSWRVIYNARPSISTSLSRVEVHLPNCLYIGDSDDRHVVGITWHNVLR